MNLRNGVRCACQCGVRVYPSSPELVKIDGLDYGGEDWWIDVKCKVCGGKTMFGGTIPAGTENLLRGGEMIHHPEYD